MKNCIIIHGGPLTAEAIEPHNLHTLYWQPWVANELEQQGVPAVVPPMPHPWQPVYEEWKEAFETLPVTNDSILIGHSRGAAFLLRWLSETKKEVRQLIMVAPNLRTESDNAELQKFYDFTVDADLVNRVPSRVVFTSENDDLENMESAQLIAKKLKCKVINLPEHGHFITQEMGTDEFPELIAEIV